MMPPFLELVATAEGFELPPGVNDAAGLLGDTFAATVTELGVGGGYPGNVLPDGTTATTQAAQDDSNQVATTEYVDDLLTSGELLIGPIDFGDGSGFSIVNTGGAAVITGKSTGSLTFQVGTTTLKVTQGNLAIDNTNGVTAGTPAITTKNGLVTALTAVTTVSLKAQTAVTSGNILANAAAGLYRLSCYFIPTAGTRVYTCTIGWTDDNGAFTLDMVSNFPILANGGASGVIMIENAATGSITYSVTAIGTGAFTYSLYLVLESI